MSGVSARARGGRCRAACALLLRDLGGFNLLPHRARRRRRVRQRRAFGAACAALGGVGVAAIVSVAAGRNDIAAEQNRQRLESDLAAAAIPMAEYASLQAELGAYRAFCEHATQRAVRRDQLLALLDRLSRAAAHDVRLTELSRHGDETFVSGQATGQSALSAWLNELRHAPGVVSTSVLSFRRVPPDREAADTGRTTPAGAFNFTARLTHAGTRPSVSPHEQRVVARGVEQSVHAGEAS